MPTLDEWKTASRIWGHPDDATTADAAVLAHLQDAATAWDILGGLPWHQALPYVVIAAYHLDATAYALLGVELDASITDPETTLWDAEIRALMPSMSSADLRFIAGRRYQGDSPTALADLVARHASSAVWAGLRLAQVTSLRPAVPGQIRWDDPSQMTERLHMVATEVAGPNGDYELTLTYSRRSSKSVPVVQTIKAYTGGDVGPTLRGNTHRLYRDDDTYLEWADPEPKEYNGDESMSAGRERRRRHADTLIASLQSAVVGGGGDPSALLGSLLPYVDAFVETSSPAPLLAAVESAAASLLPAVTAALAPWVPTE